MRSIKSIIPASRPSTSTTRRCSGRKRGSWRSVASTIRGAPSPGSKRRSTIAMIASYSPGRAARTRIGPSATPVLLTGLLFILDALEVVVERASGQRQEDLFHGRRPSFTLLDADLPLELVRCVERHDLAAVDDRDTVAQPLRLVHVMRCQEDR